MSTTLPPLPTGSAPWEYRATKEQREEVHWLCGTLRSDLFERAAGPPGRPSAIWESPLHWRVEYGYMTDGVRIWARVYRPDGSALAETTSASAEWLDGVLP